jgi:hypothetical protein
MEGASSTISPSMYTKTEGFASRIVISQPMFLPWRGIFEQIRLCRQFVFYDDVQLPLGGGRGRGFTTRVQIKTAKGVDWLTLPVIRADKGKQLINAAQFAHMDWKQEHLSKIAQAYKAAPYFEPIYETVVKPIYAIETDSLAEFCMQSTKLLCAKLGLTPEMYVSSELPVSRDTGASKRVLDICEHLGASEYISGLGAMNYLDYALFEEAGVRVCYMDYQLPPYAQLHGEFTPYVSIIDMLFNLGCEGTEAELGSEATYWKLWPSMQDGRPSIAAAEIDLGSGL